MIEQVVSYFDTKLEMFGLSLKAMGYNRTDAFGQYAALRESINPKGKVVLDIGCGLGIGSVFFSDCLYYGCDGSAEMIAGAQKIHPEIRDAFSVNISPPFPVDWIVMSCLFSVGYDKTEIRKMLGNCLENAKEGIALTFLTKKRDSMTVFPLDWWVAQAEQFSSRWVLRHDFSSHIGLLVLHKG